MAIQDELSDEMKGKVFVQILEHIRKQDDLIHSWAKYYISIQAGLGIALAFILRLRTATSGFLIEVGPLIIPLLGIATTFYLTRIIVREHIWQGKYIRSLNKLKNLPVIYETDPEPNKPGYIARQFLQIRLILIIGWTVVGVLYYVFV